MRTMSAVAGSAVWGTWLLLGGNALLAADVKNATSTENYQDIVLTDQPVGYWRLGDPESDMIANQVEAPDSAVPLVGRVTGKLTLQVAGPRSAEFPLFHENNTAVDFGEKAASIRIADPGENSPLDFDAGDSMTLEAWVNPRTRKGNGFYYIIGKGRTFNKGFSANNQNYALRLSSSGTGAKLSFLFHSRGKDGDWHRWTSSSSLGIGDGWHHVAICYTFGKKDSLRGYIDGEPTKGKWDMGGATNAAPIVDNDELWIGSSMGDKASSTFAGGLDEVAVYRTALSPERISARFRYIATSPEIDLTRIPDQGVLVDIYEGLHDKTSWRFRPPKFVESYIAPGFAWTDVPNKYSATGVKIDRSNPFLIRAYGYVEVPEGQQRILLRSRNASRLYMDDIKIAETAFHSIVGTAHGHVFKVDTSLAPSIRPLQRGDTEDVALITGDGRPHLFRFEMIVGGRTHRPEMGETSVSMATPDSDFQLLTYPADYALTDEGWQAFADSQRKFLQDLNQDRRQVAAVKENEYWQSRHKLARQAVAKQPRSPLPASPADFPVNNDIDRFINRRLADAGEQPAALSDDLAFLRRVSVDTIGTVPTLTEIEAFLADDPQQRRSRVIDQLLARDGWADNWVGYWQDVLAENPNIVNPTLNNTGPFRWWIHESFLDNKPFDRFVTELVMMEGSAYYGGPGGFEMATQNDVPMAAKAHIIAQAFLGLEMKCARCHDAPFHDFAQRDLFSLAAMLKREPQPVPKSSTIPGDEESLKSLIVKVTLKPGEKVEPVWTFDELAHGELPPGVLHDANDPRERVAALITSPENTRFSQVIVNRLWKRYLGRGMVEPVDDWENAEPTHSELLDFLAREFVEHDYDLKHIARLILNSHVYQRVPRDAAEITAEPYLFASPVLRRLTAEQLVDSLFAVAGKRFDSDPMCIDIDTARSYKVSLNLGQPTRAWQFTSMSNERDRPSLALPFAQPFVTALETFGWRSSRQDPITVRDQTPTVLQPAILANGVMARRITRLSDDNSLTKLALVDQPLDTLIEKTYLQLLTRRPSANERQMFVELLKDGYEDRRVKSPPKPTPKPRLRRNLVSWSNHLDPEANEIKVELQAAVRQGDEPTVLLQADWRERMEDVLWALANSPEFVYLP